MKKLRFFGMMAAVVLLAFGLALGCSNGSTDGEDTSEPERLTRYVDETNQVEIVFSNRAIAAKARAVQSNDNYSIKKAGVEVSKGWVEVGSGGVFIFHPTGSDETFQGFLSGDTLSVASIPVAGGGTISASATLPGSPPSGGGTNGKGSGGGGGGGGGSSGGGGYGGGGILGGTGGSDGSGGTASLAPGQPAGFVEVETLVLTGKNYIVLDRFGAGEVKLEAKVVPENATNKTITWAYENGSTKPFNPAPNTIASGPMLSLDSRTGVLRISGVTQVNYSGTLQIKPTVANGKLSATREPELFENPANNESAFEITVYEPGTVVPAITLNNGGAAVATGSGLDIGQQAYIWNRSTVSLSAPEGWDIYYLMQSSDTAITDPVPVSPAALYANPISFGTYKSGDMAIRVMAKNRASGAESEIVDQLFSQALAPFTVTLENDDAGYVITNRTRFVVSSVPGATISYGFIKDDTAPSAYTPYTGPTVIASGDVNDRTQQDILLQVKVIATGYADTIADATTPKANQKLLRARAPMPSIAFKDLASLNWTVKAKDSSTSPGYIAGVTSFTLSTPGTTTIYYKVGKAAVAPFFLSDTTISQYSSGVTIPAADFDPNNGAGDMFFLGAYATREGYMQSDFLDYRGPTGATNGLGPAQLKTPLILRGAYHDAAVGDLDNIGGAYNVANGTTVNLSLPGSSGVSINYATPATSVTEPVIGTSGPQTTALPANIQLGTGASGDAGGALILSVRATKAGFRDSASLKVTYTVPPLP